MFFSVTSDSLKFPVDFKEDLDARMYYLYSEVFVVGYFKHKLRINYVRVNTDDAKYQDRFYLLLQLEISLILSK